MLEALKAGRQAPKRLLRRSRHIWFSPARWRRRIVFLCGAIGVGIAAILFAIGTEYANAAYHRVVAASPYLPFVIAPAGLAFVLFITRRLFPDARGSGIPQTIAALQSATNPSFRDAVLSPRIAVGKTLLTLVALVSGASVGREGPTVQVGAAIMYSLGKFVHLPHREMERGLILAGGAAGVAAAFNTPLAGVVFAIEELSRSFEQRTSGIILTAVIIAGVVSMGLLGNYSYFGHTSASLDLRQGWIVIIACGAAGGLLGGLFSQILIVSSRRLPGPALALLNKQPLLFAAISGLVLAAIGIASGSNTYGTGYDEARRILEGSASVPQSYGVLKMAATIVSYVCGIPGGIFSPSLSVGAGLGFNMAALMPYAPAGAVVILGMVGYFAGVVQAPITAFVIVMEMTDNTSMVIPLMATSLIGSAASRLVCPKSVYKALAADFLQRPAAGAKAPE